MSPSTSREDGVDALKTTIEGIDPADMNPGVIADEVAQRLGGRRIENSWQVLPLPFPEPQGFVLPPQTERRPSSRQRDAILRRLADPRPETRRVALLAIAGLIDDATVEEAVRQRGADPDPYVRGLTLFWRGVALDDEVEDLIAEAELLTATAHSTKAGTWESVLAWEAAAYAVLGTLAASVRGDRRDVAPTVLTLIDALRREPDQGRWQTDGSTTRPASLHEIAAIWLSGQPL